MAQQSTSEATKAGRGNKIALIVVSILSLAIVVAIPLAYLFMLNAEESAEPAPVGSETAMVDDARAPVVGGLAVAVYA